MDMQKHTHHRDWLRLPENVIATISDKLSLCDFLPFNNVCKLWRSFQKETLMIHPNPLGGFPWLGSIEDWLVIAKPLSYDSDELYIDIRISLLNPFSGAEVVLPEAYTNYNKLVFSGDPGKATCVYMAFSYVSPIFFVWIPEAKDWLESCLEEETDDVLIDLISFNGCFYFLTREYNIRVVDAAYAYSTVQSNGYADQINTQFYQVKMSPDIPIESSENVQIVRYLVEFRGEILLVIRFMRNLFKETYDFKVFQLDFSQMVWVKLDSLGDFGIFVGRNCTRCYSTKDLGVNKGNCIYFTNEVGTMGLIEWDHKLSCSDIDDWGIFRLSSGDGSGGSERFSHHASKDRRSPIWLTAPLSWYFDKSKVSSSNVDDPSASLSKSEQNSPKNEKSDAAEVDLAKTGAGTDQANTAQQESSPSSSKKQKAPQTEAAEDLVVDDDSGLTNAKRARRSETSEPSAKSPSD
ncbi:hypothetical protein LWI29_026410 [Acer saccharum]|uniref:KIB1-4 beta-propeller domain-containing protein n=1 Tax=Acer saccharum TaxID=4024 RepID=A0AA39SN69_ACESA|nr:hypothetical protein LWI29_026410 [Acer saccharum]